METLLDEISECGGLKSLVSCEVYISAAIAAVVVIAGLLTDFVPPSSVFSTMFTASAAMLGLIIASYSLVLNAGDKEFKKIFYKDYSFKNLRVDFSMTALYLGGSSVINLLAFVLYDLIVPISPYVAAIGVFMCMLGLLSIVVLMTNSLRLLGGVLSIGVLPSDRGDDP